MPQMRFYVHDPLLPEILYARVRFQTIERYEQLQRGLALITAGPTELTEPTKLPSVGSVVSIHSGFGEYAGWIPRRS